MIKLLPRAVSDRVTFVTRFRGENVRDPVYLFESGWDVVDGSYRYGVEGEQEARCRGC